MRKNIDYVFKVLLPECLIKFYMEFFDVNKGTAEANIRDYTLFGKNYTLFGKRTMLLGRNGQ
jgi:hypothetical protein